MEKKKEEARQRAEKEVKELLEKRKRLLAENQNQSNSKKPNQSAPAKPSPNPSSSSSKPSSSSSTKTSTASTSSKPSSSSSKPSSNPAKKPNASSSNSKTNSKLPSKTNGNNKPKPSSTQSSSKPVLSYQDILKLADNNQNKPKTLANSSSSSDLQKLNATQSENTQPSKSSKIIPSNKPQSQSNLGLNNPASKLKPEQIAKLREKQKRPQAVPVSSRIDLNNNKNKPNGVSSMGVNPSSTSVSNSKNKTIDSKPGSSLSSWDRIVSDMKKIQSKVIV